MANDAQMPERHLHWAVTVETGGEQIVRIETECYGGRELSASDEEAVRTAAHHLLAFIGDRSADMAECAAFSAGYEAGERDGRASAALRNRTGSPDAEASHSQAAVDQAPQPAGEAVPVAWQQRHQGSWITMSEELTAQDCSDWPQNEFRPLYAHQLQPIEAVADAVAEAVADEWREIEQAQQPRLADGYTAVRISKPGFWLVKGPGPATALALRALKGEA